MAGVLVGDAARVLARRSAGRGLADDRVQPAQRGERHVHRRRRIDRAERVERESQAALVPGVEEVVADMHAGRVLGALEEGARIRVRGEPASQLVGQVLTVGGEHRREVVLGGEVPCPGDTGVERLELRVREDRHWVPSRPRVGAVRAARPGDGRRGVAAGRPTGTVETGVGLREQLRDQPCVQPERGDLLMGHGIVEQEADRNTGHRQRRVGHRIRTGRAGGGRARGQRHVHAAGGIVRPGLDVAEQRVVDIERGRARARPGGPAQHREVRHGRARGGEVGVVDRARPGAETEGQRDGDVWRPAVDQLDGRRRELPQHQRARLGRVTAKAGQFAPRLDHEVGAARPGRLRDRFAPVTRPVRARAVEPAERAGIGTRRQRLGAVAVTGGLRRGSALVDANLVRRQLRPAGREAPPADVDRLETEIGRLADRHRGVRPDRRCREGPRHRDVRGPCRLRPRQQQRAGEHHDRASQRERDARPRHLGPPRPPGARGGPCARVRWPARQFR